MNPMFVGAATALVTPMTDDGVNLAAWDRLLDFQLAEGIAGLVVTGTTGEPSTLSLEEKTALWKAAIAKSGGRVPVIAGTGGNDTKKVVRESHIAAECGADALLIVTPYYNYNKPTPRGLIAHYRAVAEVGLPIIVYNVPARTGLNLTPDLLAHLCDIPQVTALKEASGNINQMTALAERFADRLTLYCGEDAIILPAMSLGYRGVISVISNLLPRQTNQLVLDYEGGDIAAARAAQFAMNPLVSLLFCEVSPGPAKTALRAMGHDMGPLRLPLDEMDPANAARLRDCMTKMGLCQ